MEPSVEPSFDQSKQPSIAPLASLTTANFSIALVSLSSPCLLVLANPKLIETLAKSANATLEPLASVVRVVASCSSQVTSRSIRFRWVSTDTLIVEYTIKQNVPYAQIMSLFQARITSGEYKRQLAQFAHQNGVTGFDMAVASIVIPLSTPSSVVPPNESTATPSSLTSLTSLIPSKVPTLNPTAATGAFYRNIYFIAFISAFFCCLFMIIVFLGLRREQSNRMLRSKHLSGSARLSVDLANWMGSSSSSGDNVSPSHEVRCVYPPEDAAVVNDKPNQKSDVGVLDIEANGTVKGSDERAGELFDGVSAEELESSTVKIGVAVSSSRSLYGYGDPRSNGLVFSVADTL